MAIRRNRIRKMSKVWLVYKLIVMETKDSLGTRAVLLFLLELELSGLAVQGIHQIKQQKMATF